MSSPTDEITQVGQPAGGCVMIIFGASGDLTKRKLIPAIYNLSRSHCFGRISPSWVSPAADEP